MRNIKLTIEYDGKGFSGWQTQAGKQRTVQATLEKALKRILRKEIKIGSSGRTDSGVHARAQVANFKTDSGISAEKLRMALNAVLPDDISVIVAEEAAAGFHSRFSAKSKVYRYTILNRPSRSAILRDRVYFFPQPLSLTLMRKEAKVLLGRHNFKSFQAADKKDRDPVKTVKNIKITRKGDFIYIDIEADGFLYNMARNIAGTLIDAGRGRLPAGSLRRILTARNRQLAGQTLPAKGLCLLEVKYK